MLGPSQFHDQPVILVTRTKSESENRTKTTTKHNTPSTGSTDWIRGVQRFHDHSFIVASALESKHENHTQNNRKNTTPQRFEPRMKLQKPQLRCPKEPRNEQEQERFD
jgi:hypothetical protein